MSSPLLKATDLNSLLIFEKLCDDWVREVHKFTSERKKKKSFVIFRNSNNKKLTSLDELKAELEDVSFLENLEFKSAFSHDIVSNRVGANKIARKAAKAWMADPKAQISKPMTVKEKPVKLEFLPVQEKCPAPEKVQETIPEVKEALLIKEISPLKDTFVEETRNVETAETDVTEEVINAAYEQETVPVVENEKSPPSGHVETPVVEEEVEDSANETPTVETEFEEEVIQVATSPDATELTVSIQDNSAPDLNEALLVQDEKEVTDLNKEIVMLKNLDAQIIEENSAKAVVKEQLIEPALEDMNAPVKEILVEERSSVIEECIVPLKEDVELPVEEKDILEQSPAPVEEKEGNKKSSDAENSIAETVIEEKQSDIENEVISANFNKKVASPAGDIISTSVAPIEQEIIAITKEEVATPAEEMATAPVEEEPIISIEQKATSVQEGKNTSAEDEAVVPAREEAMVPVVEKNMTGVEQETASVEEEKTAPVEEEIIALEKRYVEEDTTAEVKAFVGEIPTAEAKTIIEDGADPATDEVTVPAVEEVKVVSVEQETASVEEEKIAPVEEEIVAQEKEYVEEDTTAEEKAFIGEIPAPEAKTIKQDGADPATDELTVPAVDEVVVSKDKIDNLAPGDEISASVEEEIAAPLEDKIETIAQNGIKDKADDISKEKSIDNLSTDSDLGSVESLEHSTKDELDLDDSFSDTEIIIKTNEDKLEKIQPESQEV